MKRFLAVLMAGVLVLSAVAATASSQRPTRFTRLELTESTALTNEVFLPAGDFLGNAGSPARAAIGSANAQGWLLDAASDESISAMFRVPDAFVATDVACYVGWSTTATSGDAIFDVITVPTAVTEDSGLAGNTDSVTDTAGDTADDLQEASVTVSASTEWAAGDVVYVTINRDANNGADDLAADASVQYLRCGIYGGN